jgi:hypothetical protein
MEEQYPMLSDDQLEYLCGVCSSMNQACYMGCKMKAKSDKVKVGPIEVENDASYWINLADVYFDAWQAELTSQGKSRSLTGKCVGRADEF